MSSILESINETQKNISEMLKSINVMQESVSKLADEVKNGIVSTRSTIEFESRDDMLNFLREKILGVGVKKFEELLYNVYHKPIKDYNLGLAKQTLICGGKNKEDVENSQWCRVNRDNNDIITSVIVDSPFARFSTDESTAKYWANNGWGKCWQDVYSPSLLGCNFRKIEQTLPAYTTIWKFANGETYNPSPYYFDLYCEALGYEKPGKFLALKQVAN